MCRALKRLRAVALAGSVPVDPTACAGGYRARPKCIQYARSPAVRFPVTTERAPADMVVWCTAALLEALRIGVLLAERRDPAQGAILRRWLEAQVLPAFVERILPVDTAVARRSATLHVPDPRPVRDSLVAATALVHGMTVVTRNVTDFAPTGVATLDPWAAM